MSRDQSTTNRLPKGVTLLDRSRNGRRFAARIRRKGVEVALGLYESAGLAGFAFNVASEVIGRGVRPPNEIPGHEQPDAPTVAWITAKVRRRLGIDPARNDRNGTRPDPAALLTFFEITVVGFWRDQAAQSAPEGGLDSAARRLAEAASLVFWSPQNGHPDPSEVLIRLLSARLDRAFRRADLIRAILDDDGDEDWRIARWLIQPDIYPPGRGFIDEVRFLYHELFEDDPEPGAGSGIPHWAKVLAIDPPFSLDKVKDAYRSRSKFAHPDLGGSHQDFVRLQAAYDEARAYCRYKGV